MCLNETLTYSSLDFRDPPPPCSLARDFNRFAVREDVQPLRENLLKFAYTFSFRGRNVQHVNLSVILCEGFEVVRQLRRG